MRNFFPVFVVFCFSCGGNSREAFAALQKIDAALTLAKQSCDTALNWSESKMDEENDRQIWAREIIAAERCVKEFAWAESEISIGIAAIPLKVGQYIALGRRYLRAAESFLALWKQRIECLSIPDRDDNLDESYECAEIAEKLDEESSSLFLRAKAAYKPFTNHVARGGEK